MPRKGAKTGKHNLSRITATTKLLDHCISLKYLAVLLSESVYRLSVIQSLNPESGYVPGH